MHREIQMNQFCRISFKDALYASWVWLAISGLIYGGLVLAVTCTDLTAELAMLAGLLFLTIRMQRVAVGLIHLIVPSHKLSGR